MEKKRTNFEWLDCKAKIKYNDWHNDLVIEPYTINHYKFYLQIFSEPYTAKINPIYIKGIKYADAYNFGGDKITWFDLLNQLRRFDYIKQNFNCREELEQHVRAEYKETKILNKYGDIYITTHGQHRMALAKFLELDDVEVTVNEYIFDERKYQCFMLCKEIISMGFDTLEDNKIEDMICSGFIILKYGSINIWLKNEMIESFIKI